MIRSFYRNLKNLITYFNRKDVKIGSNIALQSSHFEGKNRVYDNTTFIRSRMGRGSYIGKDGNFNDTLMGRYCSVGNRVKIVSYTHPSKNYVSTHPAFFSLLMQAGFTYTLQQTFQEQRLLDREARIAVTIGNDVWIGDEAMIMGGLKIHDGAIIAARSVITRDVPPYTIVGGVPAKEIGKRFNDKEIEFLLNFRWWEKSEEWISNNIEIFQDIKQFMLKANTL